MNMTLRQKVGQLVMCSLDDNVVDDTMEAFLTEYCVGNIIHFGNNVTGFEDSKALNAKLRSLIMKNCAGVPPIISVDHEGGRVMRFSQDFTWFPSQMAMSAAKDLALTEAIGEAMGTELRAAGFNLSISPVLDVVVHKNNAVLSVRCFGDDPQQIATQGIALARGLQKAGVVACMKHFPGGGDTELDSHYFLPKVDKGRDVLDERELVPFKALIDAKASDAMMTTHILYPQLEEKDFPATMSETILEGILRKELGYDGLVMTDGIHMKAIADHYGVERGCIEAIKAGCDMICVGTGGSGVLESQKSCCEALYQAVVSGEIPMARLEEAVARILRVKEKFIMNQQDCSPDFAVHQALNEAVCGKAATAQKPQGNVLTGRVLCASAEITELAFGLTHADPRRRSFGDMASEILDCKHVSLAQVPHEEYDTLLLGCRWLTADCEEYKAMQQALAAGKQVAMVLTGSPFGAELLPA